MSESRKDPKTYDPECVGSTCITLTTPLVHIGWPVTLALMQWRDWIAQCNASTPRRNPGPGWTPWTVRLAPASTCPMHDDRASLTAWPIVLTNDARPLNIPLPVIQTDDVQSPERFAPGGTDRGDRSVHGSFSITMTDDLDLNSTPVPLTYWVEPLCGFTKKTSL